MSTESSRAIGVVLAGGRSSRMGRDKAMLPWQGRPLIEHQMAVLRAAGVRDVLVSGDRPGYHGVVDPMPELGPVGGIAGIASACSDTELLIVPVDMPRLQASLLQRLIGETPETGCVRFAGHVLPMRLRLDNRCRSVLAELMLACDQASRSLRTLQQRVGVEEIALQPGEAEQLIDCNTEERWREVTA